MKRAAGALFVLLALSGCRGCAGAEPPDLYAVTRLHDPYDTAPAKGSVSDLERAVGVIDQVAKELGYGDLPAKHLRNRAREAWAGRLVMFLAHGGDEQLHAAWRDLLTTTVEAYYVPVEVKYKLRQAEARVYDLAADKVDADTMRAGQLAEIAWTLYLLATVSDAG